MSRGRQLLDRLGEMATSVIGNAAGATVAPGTALVKLRTAAVRPPVLLCAGLVGGAYLLGRRAGR